MIDKGKSKEKERMDKNGEEKEEFCNFVEKADLKLWKFMAEKQNRNKEK